MNIVQELARKPPRRVRTAYAYFVQDNYPFVARQLGTRQPQPIIKAIGKQWKTVDERVKEQYAKREVKDRERYRTAKIEWTKNYNTKVPKLRRRKKDRQAPKRSRNAFVYYEKEMWPEVRTANPNWTQQEMIREIAKQWRQLRDDEKRDYIDEANDDKKRYARELREYHRQKLQTAKDEAATRQKHRGLLMLRGMNVFGMLLEPEPLQPGQPQHPAQPRLQAARPQEPPQPQPRHVDPRQPGPVPIPQRDALAANQPLNLYQELQDAIDFDEREIEEQELQDAQENDEED